MIEGIFGKKIGMTQIYDPDSGVATPVTVIKTEPCYVVQRKTSEREGYEAVLLGTCEKKEKRTTRPMRGVFKKAGTPNLRILKEFRCEAGDEYRPGTTVRCADLFKAGQFVDITGRTKGKGFQGTVRRWGFAGGPASHGAMHGRRPGSIGQSSYPSRVFKGLRMAGHMGAREVTVQNLEIIEVRPDEDILVVKGAVPGAAGTYLAIKRSLKKRPAEGEGE